MRCSSVSFMGSASWAAAPSRGHLDLDLHARIDEAAYQGGCGRADRAKDFAQHWHDRWPIHRVRYVIADSYDISEAGARLRQCRLDVAKRLACLLGRVRDDRHLRIVEPSRARDKDPIAVNDCPTIPSLCLEARPGGD